MNILYVHGYNGSPTGHTFQRLKNYENQDIKIFPFEYNDKAPSKSLELLRSAVDDNDIDLVIGSSLGGFISLQLYGFPRILINPCLFPSEELPKIGMPERYAMRYEKFESNFNLKVPKYDKDICFACFADNDELFGDKYKELFSSKYKHIYSIPGGHHISDKGIEIVMTKVIPDIIEILNS